MRVMVFGTFDDLHPGHRYLLENASKRAGNGTLSVVVARDSNVMKIKGHSPLQAEDQRMAAIKKAFPDAEVMLGDAEDFLVPVKKVKPGLILLGYDQKLPPGVSEESLGCSIERLEAFMPEVHKSSLRRSK